VRPGDAAAASAQPEAALDILGVMRSLPHRYPMLLVDRVLEMVLNERITALKAVTMNELFFQGHFPGRPIMPGVMIIEALAQAAGVLAVKSLGEGEAGKLVYFMSIENAKFRVPVEPGVLLRLEANLLHKRGKVWKFEGRALVEGRVATEANFTAMIVDPPAR
jgi:3-hydroxyacyl-[acyl-carrier-protein] dehydratase